MARKVKCIDTGEYSTSDVAFQAPNKKYFSNKRAYEMWEKNKEYRQKCISRMYNIMGYSPQMIIPTFFYKKLKDFEGVGYEALYNTMLSQTDAIQWALNNKQFTGESSKVMYITAILDNHIMDEYKKLIKQQKEQEKFKNSTSDYLIVDEFVNVDSGIGHKKDISKWLEDEDE